jgi:hypothetical protein
MCSSLSLPNSNNTVSYFDFKEISCLQVRNAIDCLKNSQSKDYYHLNMDIIKAVKDTIISPLTKLINNCIEKSCFSDCLKHTLVIPVHKKGNLNEIKNYRPISLTSVFSKIFEKVLFLQFVEHLESNQIRNDCQFGYTGTG